MNHRHASCIGNFAEISDLVLAKVGLGLEMNKNQSIAILQGARTGTAQDDTDSRRVPVSLCLERWGGCVGHCRFANSH